MIADELRRQADFFIDLKDLANDIARNNHRNNANNNSNGQNEPKQQAVEDISPTEDVLDDCDNDDVELYP
jgi:hypothetical protein